MKQNNIEEILKLAVRHISDLDGKIRKRCLLEGCCYGYEVMDEEPREKCIYCGTERYVEYCGDEMSVSLKTFISLQKEK